MQTSQLSGLTRIIAILGYPIDHVLAPRAYNPAFDAEGLDWCLVPLSTHPDDLQDMLTLLVRTDNVLGLNVTIPHKVAACNHCSLLGPEAIRTGVVNTLRREPDGRWAGESFDGVGFIQAARQHGMLRTNRPALLVGTGGAGTAIAFALVEAGIGDLMLMDIDHERARKLADKLIKQYPELQVNVGLTHASSAGLAVNATPMGLHSKDPLPFDPSILADDCAVFDIIAARDTELMAASSARGLRTIGGRPMIDHQIAAQIAFWRGEHFLLEERT
jgi:shikimate dehydrogenase